MRTVVLAVLIFLGSAAQAREPRRLSCMTAVGTGFDMSRPSHTPFTWRIIGRYNFSGRLSAGIGTGVSFFEKPLIPLFADAKFNLCKPRKLTPFVDCCAGYGFAVFGDANGGVCINPAVGITCSVCARVKLFVSAGYELQRLERLKTYENALLRAEFAEQLSHNLLSLRIGIEF